MNDDLITPESELQETQQREQVRPKYSFKGQELAPYSRGTRILYGMISDDRDLVIYRVMAFLYIHLNPRSEVIPMVWGDINKFREKMIDYRETLSDQDIEEANKLVDEILRSDAETRVVAEPETDGKKNADET